MKTKFKVEDGDIFVPADEFFTLIKKIILPGLTFDSKREFLEIDIVRFDITGINIESKSNGTIIRLATKKPFSERNISSFIWTIIEVSELRIFNQLIFNKIY